MSRMGLRTSLPDRTSSGINTGRYGRRLDVTKLCPNRHDDKNQTKQLKQQEQFRNIYFTRDKHDFRIRLFCGGVKCASVVKLFQD